MFYRRTRPFSLRRFVLFAGDFVSVFGSFWAAAYVRLRPSGDWWTGYLQSRFPYLVCSGAIFLLVFYASGMYERETLTRRTRCTWLPLISVAVALLLSMVFFYARLAVGLGRGVLLISGFFIFLAACALRHGYRLAAGHGFLSRRALVVGDGEEVDRVLDLLRDTEDSGFKVYGVISCTQARRGEFMQGVPVLGALADLRGFVDAYEIETIVVAARPARADRLLGELRPLRYAGIEVTDYVSLVEELGQEIPLDHIDDGWLMSAAMNSSVLHIRKIKRMMDIVVSLMGLLVTLPITLPAAVLIRLDSRGPVLYRQRRARLEGRPYTLLKFRTMRQDAESGSGPRWAGRDDGRATRVGRLLRRWRVDEIPQLVNVLRGDMSLVGPRPERPEFIEKLAERIPYYKERLLVPPGITGWAQVKFPYAASIDAARRKLQYDLYYIKHMGLLLDVQILLRTVRTVLGGIRHSEETPADPRREGETTVAGGGLQVLSSGEKEESEAEEHTA